MLRFLMVFLTLTAICALPLCAYSGDLDPPGGPSHPDSAMYSLEDIYYRLARGDAGEKRINGFVEPATDPDAGSGYTLDDIMDAAPEQDQQGALPGEVLEGKTYWGLRTGGNGWGLQTGTMTSRSLSPDSIQVEAGYYQATTLDVVDINLIPRNIRHGVTIFGVDGNFNGTTCNGTLSAGSRWCDNGDGTVTDMTSGLIWLKDAGCMGDFAWRDAIDEVIETVEEGVCGLSDGSIWGDWRLPTRAELAAIKQGTESISYPTPRFFTGLIDESNYWSKTSHDISSAWIVIFGDFLQENTESKTASKSVWPVRRQVVINPMTTYP